MTDKEKRIIETCGAMLPRMSEREKDDFLKFTEGMAFLSDYRVRTVRAADSSQQRPQA